MLRAYKVQKLLDLFNLFLKYRSENFIGRYTAKISHKYSPFSVTSTITYKSFWFFKEKFLCYFENNSKLYLSSQRKWIHLFPLLNSRPLINITVTPLPEIKLVQTNIGTEQTSNKANLIERTKASSSWNYLTRIYDEFDRKKKMSSFERRKRVRQKREK